MQHVLCLEQELQMKLTPSSNMSAFLANRGGVLSLDLVLKQEADRNAPVIGRVSIPRAKMYDSYTIDKTPVQVVAIDRSVARVKLGTFEIELKRQPAGHYYGWLQPIEKAEPASDDEFFGSEQKTETSEIPF